MDGCSRSPGSPSGTATPARWTARAPPPTRTMPLGTPRRASPRRGWRAWRIQAMGRIPRSRPRTGLRPPRPATRDRSRSWLKRRRDVYDPPRVTRVNPRRRLPASGCPVESPFWEWRKNRPYPVWRIAAPGRVPGACAAPRTTPARLLEPLFRRPAGAPLPADTSVLLRVTAFDTERGSKRVLTPGQFSRSLVSASSGELSVNSPRG